MNLILKSINHISNSETMNLVSNSEFLKQYCQFLISLANEIIKKLLAFDLDIVGKK